MFGEPEDVETECNARLFIGDNYGDGTATMRCQLAPNHDGLHKEEFDRDGGTVTITWAVDERKKCSHGCGQWDHAHRDDNIKCPKDADDHEYSDCTFCHPDKEGKTCAECNKTYYYEGGHKRHCSGQPFACTDCGENGFGVHVCPKAQEAFLDRGGDDEFSEDP
jgi:hypothetical protein